MVVFSIWLGVLPVAGWGGYRHLVMPAIALALPSAAVIARLARSGVVEVMQQDYIRAARAKGLPESWVVVRHALRGALTPVVSYLGPAAATTMTGSFVVEVLFGVPGMGQWFVKGAVNRDYSVVLGTAIVYFGIDHRVQPAGRSRLRLARSPAPNRRKRATLEAGALGRGRAALVAKSSCRGRYDAACS